MTVRNARTRPVEKVQYITPDGEIYNLHDWSGKHLLTMTGWGMARGEVGITKGPFQHGVTPLSIRLQPRPVAISIRHNGCSRDDYWDRREDLIDVLRHSRTNVNLPEPGHLRWRLSNGQVRQLDVFLDDGPNFDPRRDGWDEFSIQDVIQFSAKNPIIYDPTQKSQIVTNFDCTSSSQLQFPFSFNDFMLVFGDSVCVVTQTITINYLGNWIEYPLITLTGPSNEFIIEHRETGRQIVLETDVPAGRSVTFDLTYAKKTVIDSTDASLLGGITDESDLGTFSIEPDPIVTDGINHYDITIVNGTVQSAVRMQYYDRYEGI